MEGGLRKELHRGREPKEKDEEETTRGRLQALGHKSEDGRTGGKYVNRKSRLMAEIIGDNALKAGKPNLTIERIPVRRTFLKIPC